MKKNLISFVCMALFVIMSVGAMAQQKGDMAVGGHLAFGTGESYSNMGVGARFQWNAADKIRLEPSFTFFLKKDFVSMWDISANVHYLFPMSDKLILYPSAGIGMMGVTVDILGLTTYSSSEVNLNVGGGVEFRLTEALSLIGELKYNIAGNWNHATLFAGVAYRF